MTSKGLAERMDYQMQLDRWQEHASEDPELLELLAGLRKDPAALADCFYKDLSFGTGGLRGLLGAGTNRMNRFTVAAATQGLANYIAGTCLPSSVAIAYDSRHNSRLFAETAARVLAANGVTAWLFPRLAPTPLLSFAVRYLGCGAGICVTASHNPAVYNGYKVYGPDGCQITLEAAKAIQTEIGKVDVLNGTRMVPLETARTAGMVQNVPEAVFDAYIDSVAGQAMPEENEAKNAPLRVVYTPLNGTGRECVLRILKRIGVEQVSVVPSQEWPDENFPTCPYPNPEERAALEEGLKCCEALHPELLLATDPDCDRVGTAVKTRGAYRLLSGNEMGLLLLDFICRRRRDCGLMPEKPVAVTTIVSTDMADAVAAAYGVELRRTLTGFKYIGEQIGLLEKEGQTERFIFGFEESYGYLSGPNARDKDAVNASMLICQMARAYKADGLNLGQAMDRLYERFGYYQNRLLSFAFEGETGMARMKEQMHFLRQKPPAELAGSPVVRTTDYLQKQERLPLADVLSFSLADQSKVIIRPSGTEPKLKIYLFSRSDTKTGAAKRLDELERELRSLAGRLADR